MTARIEPADLVRSIYERELTVEEFEGLLRAALSDDEDMEAQVELIRWFKKRYPTARERLAYTRRKYAEWTRRPVEPTR
jgi:hypothetical protein